MEKECTKCRTVKDISCFYKSKPGKYGVASQCKKCEYERKKNNQTDKTRKLKCEAAKRYQQKNKEKVKAAEKRYYEANKDRISKRKKVWEANNKDRRKGYDLKRRIPKIEYGKKYYKNNIDYFKEYRVQHKEKGRESNKRYYQNNREKKNAYSMQWQAENRETCRKYYKNYREKNRSKVIASASLRHAAVLRAIPKWANMKAISAVYRKAQEYNKLYPESAPWQVDHIVPLRGKHVRGLHVENNLQLLPRIENLKKSNKFKPGGSI